MAHTAAALAAYGIEARHLRPFRTAADREIGLVQQVVTPHRAASGRARQQGARADGPDRRGAAAVHRPAHRTREGRTLRAADRGYGGAVKALDVLGVRVEMPTNHPIVLLRERDGDRYLPIWIGAAEATAIAYAQQGIEPPRPLTHDLMKNVIEALGHRLTEVRIVELKDGVFHAALILDGTTEISREPRTPSPWRCAPAPRSWRGSRCSRRPASRCPPRRTTTTRSSGSRSSSTRFRPRTSRRNRARPDPEAAVSSTDPQPELEGLDRERRDTPKRPRSSGS